MSGMKNTSQVVNGDTVRGRYHPTDSLINLAVPSLCTLRDFNEDKFPRVLKPGIISSALELKSIDTGTDFVICVDGKKLAPGLSEEDGDIDLFGNEIGATFHQMKQKVEEEKNAIAEFIAAISGSDNTDILYRIFLSTSGNRFMRNYSLLSL